jgi:hypothetical protein
VQDGTGLRRGGATAILVGLALLGALALPAGAGAADTVVESVTGDMTDSDATQSGRLNLSGSGTASTCGVQKPNPGLLAGMGEPAPRAYDSYTYTNLTNETICFAVHLNAGTGSPACGDEVYNATYATAFNPADPDANYLADPGVSPGAASGVNPSISAFDVAAGGTFVNVVAVVEPDPDSFCDDYIYTLHADQPFAFTLPTTTGIPAVGQGLGFTSGVWTNPHTFSYQWRRCNTGGSGCVDIPGATNGAYLVTASDVGSTLRLRVLANDGSDTSSADSAATSVVPAPPATSPQQGQGGKGSAKKCKKKGKKSSAFAAKKKGCKKKKKR